MTFLNKTFNSLFYLTLSRKVAKRFLIIVRNDFCKLLLFFVANPASTGSASMQLVTELVEVTFNFTNF